MVILFVNFMGMIIAILGMSRTYNSDTLLILLSQCIWSFDPVVGHYVAI